jgi:hypothetical protein
MKREYSFQKAPRCSATSKRTHERCKAPAVRGWTVCRFHGARGGAPPGKANGAYKHGLHTKEAREDRCSLSDLLRQSRKVMATLPSEGNNVAGDVDWAATASRGSRVPAAILLPRTRPIENM